MKDAILDFFSNNVSSELAVFITSMIPVVECRGAVPFGFILNLPFYQTFFLAILGNLLPVPFILWLIRPIINWFKKTKLLKGFAGWLERKVEKNKEKVLKYEFWGLCLFVAIPLPGTGAWTGALIAAFLDLRFKRAIPSILLGVLISATVMTAAVYGFGMMLS